MLFDRFPSYHSALLPRKSHNQKSLSPVIISCRYCVTDLLKSCDYFFLFFQNTIINIATKPTTARRSWKVSARFAVALAVAYGAVLAKVPVISLV